MLLESCLLIVLLLILVIYLFEVVAVKKEILKEGVQPIVGNVSLITSSRLGQNYRFGIRAVSLLEEGYHRFKDTAFRLLRNDGSILVLPSSALEELSTLPPHVASPHLALERDLLGRFTGLDLILESRMHHTIVQRKLTPKLGLLTPGLKDTLAAALTDLLPTSEEWVDFQPYQVLGKVSARLSARALIGPGLCNHPTWLDISFNFTECLFQTIVVLRFFPSWTHRWLCIILPSYWRGQRYVQKAKNLLGPVFRDLLARNSKGDWTPAETLEEANVLCWLADSAKGKDRNPDILAHVEVLLALASVHTTLLRMVNVLYDCTANPEILDQLRDEILEVDQSQDEWTYASYSKLHKLDSVLRESQRMSPPTTLGMKRIFKEPYIFSDGTEVSAGTYVCMPIYAIENDPANTSNPELFDGLRSYRLRAKSHGLGGPKNNSNEAFLFSSSDPTALNFGYGKSACPGRYFASLIIKMVIVRLFTEYDFRFMDGQQRPKNITVHEFLFCWPWQKMRIRKRSHALQTF